MLILQQLNLFEISHSTMLLFKYIFFKQIKNSYLLRSFVISCVNNDFISVPLQKFIIFINHYDYHNVCYTCLLSMYDSCRHCLLSATCSQVSNSKHSIIIHSSLRQKHKHVSTGRCFLQLYSNMSLITVVKLGVIIRIIEVLFGGVNVCLLEVR